MPSLGVARAQVHGGTVVDLVDEVILRRILNVFYPCRQIRGPRGSPEEDCLQTGHGLPCDLERGDAVIDALPTPARVEHGDPLWAAFDRARHTEAVEIDGAGDTVHVVETHFERPRLEPG